MLYHNTGLCLNIFAKGTLISYNQGHYVLYIKCIINVQFQDWRDERLQWDPEEFGGLTDIVVRPERIWLPELALMNGYVASQSSCMLVARPVCHIT